MSRLARIFSITVPLVLALSSSVLPIRVHAGGAPPGQPAPAGGFCCLTSQQIAAAEARLSVHPLNPQAAVWSVVHLHLVNVQVLAAGGNASVHRPNGDNTIQYIFGYTPPTHGNLFVRPHPHFVVVTEIVEQRAPSGISITPVLPAAQHPPIPTGYQSPLELVAPLPQRHLTFAIESNIPRNRLHLLGERLLADERDAGDGPTVPSRNQTPDLLGIPAFPMQTVPLPPGVSASMTVMNVPPAGGGATSRAGGGPPHGSNTVPCHTVILEGGLVCYPPRSQALAEAQLAVRPIDPTGIVDTTTHLGLTQLRLFYGYRRKGAVNLLYGFGPVCWRSEYSCPTRYLVVGEAPGPSPVPGPRMVRDREAAGGSAVRYGPWKFLAPVPRRNLVVTVYGPFPKVTVRAIGLRIVRAGS